MTFWIAAAGLTGLTCLALLAALGRKGVATADHDRMFYEAQIGEIERQLSLKLIGDAEAEAARTEAARRLLAVTPGAVNDIAHPGRMRNFASGAVLVLIPAITLPVYLARGVPDMPSFPLASRQPEKPAAPQDVNVVAALQQIETHLAKNPDDGRGHEVVGPVYLRLGRHADAARAFAAALRLLGPTADRHANLGEALVFGGNGIVTAESRAAFEAASALDAGHIKSRFFLALAAQQEGDKTKAAALLSALRSDLPDGDLKLEIGKQLAELGALPKGGEVIAALPAEDQMAAIRSMVEGLAQRLASTGGSAEEWARLIRALTVLKETERARMILTEARQKFAAQPDDLRRIEDAGKGL
jgi:cytochrome c-type biogenesis protein CcmH